MRVMEQKQPQPVEADERKPYWIMLSPEESIFDDSVPIDGEETLPYSGVRLSRLGAKPKLYAHIKPTMDDTNIQKALRVRLVGVVKSPKSKWPHPQGKRSPLAVGDDGEGRRYHLRTQIKSDPDKGKVGTKLWEVDRSSKERQILQITDTAQIRQYIESASLSSVDTLLRLEKAGIGAGVIGRVVVIEACEKRLLERRPEDGGVYLDVSDEDVVEVT